MRAHLRSAVTHMTGSHSAASGRKWRSSPFSEKRLVRRKDEPKSVSGVNMNVKERVAYNYDSFKRAKLRLKRIVRTKTCGCMINCDWLCKLNCCIQMRRSGAAELSWATKLFVWRLKTNYLRDLMSSKRGAALECELREKANIGQNVPSARKRTQHKWLLQYYSNSLVSLMSKQP